MVELRLFLCNSLLNKSQLAADFVHCECLRGFESLSGRFQAFFDVGDFASESLLL